MVCLKQIRLQMDNFLGKKLCFPAAEEMQNFAAAFAALAPPDTSIALIGPLGSGKTTFVQGLAHGFGLQDTVNSPSFNIFHQYNGSTNLLHIDAYRLDGSEAARQELMIDDFMISPYCLVVEWPELLYGFLEECRFKIEFSINPDQSHALLITKTND